METSNLNKLILKVKDGQITPLYGMNYYFLFKNVELPLSPTLTIETNSTLKFI